MTDVSGTPMDYIGEVEKKKKIKVKIEELELGNGVTMWKLHEE